MSTIDQTLQDALEKAGCERVFTDTASGATAERFGLTEAVAYARGRYPGGLEAGSAGRSLKHLSGLAERRVGFRPFTELKVTCVVLAAAHPAAQPQEPLQRCHMIHDRPYRLAQRRIAHLLRRALGDLFPGPYRLG